MRAVSSLNVVAVALCALSLCLELGAATEAPSVTAPPTAEPPVDPTEPPTVAPVSTPVPTWTPQPAPTLLSSSPPPITRQPTTSPPVSFAPVETNATVIGEPPVSTTSLPSETRHAMDGSQRSEDVGADVDVDAGDGYAVVGIADTAKAQPMREQSPTATGEAVDVYHRDMNTSRWSTDAGSASRDSDEHQVPRVIGGREDRNQASNNTYQDSGVTIETEAVAHVYHVFKYLISLAAVASLLLLLLFHGLAVDDRFDWSRVDRSPNTWEFVVYVSYVQHLLSVSQMAFVKTPYSLWIMLDALSWTGFLPYHSDTSAITIGAPRQLDTILLSGLVAFADRVGVKEGDLLVRSTTNLVIFIIALLALFFIVAAVAKRQMEYRDSLPPSHAQEEDARLVLWRKISMQVCGMLVLLWLFALYPLSVMASYEVSMEIRAGSFAAGQLLLAVITLPSLCLGGLLSVFYQVASKSESELLEPFRFILWGSLYADYNYEKRVFLVAPVLLQIASGVVIGSVMSGAAQTSILIAFHAVFVLMALGTKPFVSGSVAPWFLVAVSLIKIANLSLALSSFTATSSLSVHTRASVADAVIYLNALLVFCWSVRHMLMLAQVVRCLRDGSADRDVDVVVSHTQEDNAPYDEPMPLLYAEPEMNAVEAGGFLRLSRYK